MASSRDSAAATPPSSSHESLRGHQDAVGAMPHRRGDRPSRDRLYHRRSCPARAAGSCLMATPSTTRSPTKGRASPSSRLVTTPTTSSVRASRRSSKSSASRRLLMTAWTCPTSRNIELTSPSSRPTRILSKARGVPRDLRHWRRRVARRVDGGVAVASLDSRHRRDAASPTPSTRSQDRRVSRRETQKSRATFSRAARTLSPPRAVAATAAPAGTSPTRRSAPSSCRPPPNPTASQSSATA